MNKIVFCMFSILVACVSVEAPISAAELNSNKHGGKTSARTQLQHGTAANPKSPFTMAKHLEKWAIIPPENAHIDEGEQPLKPSLANLHLCEGLVGSYTAEYFDPRCPSIPRIGELKIGADGTYTFDPCLTGVVRLNHDRTEFLNTPGTYSLIYSSGLSSETTLGTLANAQPVAKLVFRTGPITSETFDIRFFKSSRSFSTHNWKGSVRLERRLD